MPNRRSGQTFNGNSRRKKNIVLLFDSSWYFCPSIAAVFCCCCCFSSTSIFSRARWFANVVAVLILLNNFEYFNGAAAFYVHVHNIYTQNITNNMFMNVRLLAIQRIFWRKKTSTSNNNSLHLEKKATIFNGATFVSEMTQSHNFSRHFKCLFFHFITLSDLLIQCIYIDLMKL